MKTIGRLLLLACLAPTFALAAAGKPASTNASTQQVASYIYDTEDFGPYLRDLVYVNADLDGSKIPVYVAYPKGKLVAVAILLHGITGHKDVWWQGTGPYSSRSQYTQALLNQGIAVVAMDARYHGQRASEFGYRNPKVELFYKKDITGLHQMLNASLRDVDSVLTYIQSRMEMRALPIGVLGDSMGGIMGFSVAAQGKIDFLVSLVAAPDPVPDSELIHRLSPLYLAPKVTTPVRIVVATKDIYYSIDSAKNMFNKIASSDKKLIVLNEPHDFQNTHANEIADWIANAKDVASIDYP